MTDTNQSATAVLSSEVRADDSNVMRWITMLPEVGDALLRRRNAIVAMMIESDRLEGEAREKRAEAYRASLALEASARGLWSDAEIQRAKRIAG